MVQKDTVFITGISEQIDVLIPSEDLSRALIDSAYRAEVYTYIVKKMRQR